MDAPPWPVPPLAERNCLVCSRAPKLHILRGLALFLGPDASHESRGRIFGITDMASKFQGREKPALLSKDKKFGVGLLSADGKNKAKAKAGAYT